MVRIETIILTCIKLKFINTKENLDNYNKHDEFNNKMLSSKISLLLHIYNLILIEKQINKTNS